MQNKQNKTIFILNWYKRPLKILTCLQFYIPPHAYPFPQIVDNKLVSNNYYFWKFTVFLLMFRILKNSTCTQEIVIPKSVVTRYTHEILFTSEITLPVLKQI